MKATRAESEVGAKVKSSANDRSWAIRSRLVLRRCEILLRSWLRQNYRTLLPLLLCLITILLPSYLNRHGHHPPVGTYIAIMGCLAAALTFRGAPASREGWVDLGGNHVDG